MTLTMLVTCIAQLIKQVELHESDFDELVANPDEVEPANEEYADALSTESTTFEFGIDDRPALNQMTGQVVA